MTLKRPWLHEVDAATALFVRRHAVHTDEFEQKMERASRSNDVTLWKVSCYEFDQVHDQALDDVYRTVRRQADDIFSFHSGDIQIDKCFTDATTLRHLVLHPFTRDVYVDVTPSGIVKMVYVWMHPIEVCQQNERVTRVTLDVSNIATETELHEQLKEQLQFPAHYGMNWDAFWDVITDENGVERFNEVLYKTDDALLDLKRKPLV